MDIESTFVSPLDKGLKRWNVAVGVAFWCLEETLCETIELPETDDFFHSLGGAGVTA